MGRKENVADPFCRSAAFSCRQGTFCCQRGTNHGPTEQARYARCNEDFTSGGPHVKMAESCRNFPTSRCISKLSSRAS